MLNFKDIYVDFLILIFFKIIQLLTSGHDNSKERNKNQNCS